MGYPLFTWPVTITSAAAAICVGIGGSDETLSFTAGTYRWLSGGADDFGSALDTLLDSHAGADVATQTLSDKRSQPGWVTLTCTTTIELLWEHGDVTLPAAALGWSETDTSAVTSLQSPYPPQVCGCHMCMRRTTDRCLISGMRDTKRWRRRSV